jgi:predicted RNase H-like nuclease (RuvC/YqgF family)
MNYATMTDMELIHYLDLYAEDPLLRRLAAMLGNTRGGLISDLEEAGMDPQTWTFQDDYHRMFPGQYITDLRRHRDELESDLEHTKYKLEEVETELDELKTRSIMDFVQEVWQEKRTASFKVSEAMKEIEQVKALNAKLTEQIDMWGKMNQV